jgi:ABC-type branched-subunit amino acid transport system ATPase component
MLKLIIGVKGTGKTKTLINLVNGALEVTKGDVVCIEKGVKLRYDIKPTARLIDTEEFAIRDAHALYGFVAGILASNHDVTDLFIDSTLKICKEDRNAFEALVVELDKLVEKNTVNLVMTVSMPEEEASETVRKYM